jgi:hypothetical protein
VNSLTADDLRNQVTNLLADLGDTPHAIAGALFEAGRFGIPGECGSCPVAVHLALTLCLYDVAVGDLEITAWPAYGQEGITWSGTSSTPNGSAARRPDCR